MAQKISIDSYKVIQLTEFFVNKFGYTHTLVNFIDQESDISGNEIWFINEKNKDYQLIRICEWPLINKKMFDSSMAAVIEKFKETNAIKDDYKVLDIHICKDEATNDFAYDLICIDNNYYSGIELEDKYPGLKKCIHPIKDKKETKSLLKNISNKVKENRRKLPFLIRYDNLFTLIIIGICTIISLISFYISLRYDSNSAAIIMGADYMTFTLGFKQFYRLITMAFVHGSVVHLIMNMYSLYLVGSYIERRFGHLGFLLMLFSSILIGSLTSDLFNGNQLILGMSGGLYGLLFVYILDLRTNFMVDTRRLMPLIFANLLINFLPNVAWQVHLGGIMGGYLSYLIVSKEKFDKIGPAILLVIVIVCLFIKYATIEKITPLYGATDSECLKVLYQLGFKKTADNLYLKLLEVFAKYGG